MDFLTHAHIEAFQAIRNRLNDVDRDRVDAASVEALDPARAAAHHWNFELPAHAADAALGSDATDDMRRALIATWALEMPERVAAENLPVEVTELYPWWLDRLSEFLIASEGGYDRDHWAKDVRLVLVLSVPGARSQILDLSSRVGPREVLRSALDGHGWGAVLAYLKAQGWRRIWLQNHTESRHTQDFNEAGWDRTWMTSAAICRTRPELAGTMGASWFYDPQLETISPRLNYLRLNPLKGGAFMIHQGPGEIHSQRSGATSPTRRGLIESGAYTPHSWLLAWPRSTLIPWAGQQAAELNRQAAA
ncbi:hypothetical protein [Brevundimonas variabilis]|uniref:Uncharacterized protein n=1 Tax=Brevundimonas variabilis TaxID=74312 RepID=A0A7W9FD04_9CAUL|nr:hypothetical protein [Brevundimonas variabilis]MBB5744747.1 hypothetical protein [Brevundimonas variabilis]